jgi:predicted DNA-binding transcriptional regulator YafY
MKKSERLNQELLYLTDKKIFHLKELEEKFAISERTALRDITDLEQFGLAFYSETGRSGGYHITNSKLLLPIRFNTQEINAIFFALQAIKNLSETPYSNEYQKIQTKLLKNLPQKLQNQISLQKEFVHYISQPSLNEVPFFTLLLKACLDNSVILARNFQFIKEEQKLQLLDIFYQAGNWFCHAYNLDLKRWFVLRLDKFETVKLLNTKQSVMNKEQLLDSFRQYEQEHYCIPYQCQLTKIGEQKVEYNSYPIMQIDHKHGKIYLNGKYNKEELHYLVDYLISLGSEVKVLKPKELKDSYLEKLNEIIQQY